MCLASSVSGQEEDVLLHVSMFGGSCMGCQHATELCVILHMCHIAHCCIISDLDAQCYGPRAPGGVEWRWGGGAGNRCIEHRRDAGMQCSGRQQGGTAAHGIHANCASDGTEGHCGTAPPITNCSSCSTPAVARANNPSGKSTQPRE